MAVPATVPGQVGVRSAYARPDVHTSARDAPGHPGGKHRPGHSRPVHRRARRGGGARPVADGARDGDCSAHAACRCRDRSAHRVPTPGRRFRGDPAGTARRFRGPDRTGDGRHDGRYAGRSPRRPPRPDGCAAGRRPDGRRPGVDAHRPPGRRAGVRARPGSRRAGALGARGVAGAGHSRGRSGPRAGGTRTRCADGPRPRRPASPSRPAPLPAPGKLAFPAAQTYSDGSVVTWADPAVEGQPEPAHPAPAFTVTAAKAVDPAVATAEPVPGTGSTDPLSRWLAGGALLAALTALAFSVPRRRPGSA